MKTIDLTCIIDDDPIFVFGTKKLMQSAGICNNFLVYGNGKKALDSLKPMLENNEKIPDMILLDLNMPVMDGWQFLDELVKINPVQKINIFIVTSSIHNSDVQRAAEYKIINNYIVKPLQRDQVLEMIQGSYEE